MLDTPETEHEKLGGVKSPLFSMNLKSIDFHLQKS